MNKSLIFGILVTAFNITIATLGSVSALIKGELPSGIFMLIGITLFSGIGTGLHTVIAAIVKAKE